MSARDWLESMRLDVLEVQELADEIEAEYSRSGPHGQGGGCSGGGSHDSMRGIDRIVDERLREKLARRKARLERRLSEATDVLYGRSGSGGLAKARGSIDADILCRYYLQGYEWADLPKLVDCGDVSRPNGWCRLRAMRALAYVDRVGIHTLADS